MTDTEEVKPTTAQEEQNDKAKEETKEESNEKMQVDETKKDDDDTEDLKGDGGIIKKIIKEGEGWATPKKGADVTVHYVGTLTNGEKFDSSRDRDQPFNFKLGVGQVIKGWDEGVKSMKKGEIAKFTLSPDYAYGANGSPPKIPPNATLIFEVELISWDDEVDVTKDGGVLKRIETEGESWETPKEDSTVTVNYKVKLGDKVIQEKTNFNFIIGAEEVLPGLEKAVESMKKGEKATVKVSPQYAYGKNGDNALGVPGDATLVYDIELVDFTKEKGSWEMEADEKFEACEKAKTEGNDLFKINKIDRAAKKYKKAIGYVDSDYSMTDEQKQKAKNLKLPCYLNLAACKLKQKNWKDVIENCNKALEIDLGNVKALFRRAQAYSALDEWDSAKADFNKALEKEPNNADVKREFAKLKQKIRAQNEQDKKRFKNMFQRMSAIEEKEKKTENNDKSTTNSVETAKSSSSSTQGGEEKEEKESSASSTNASAASSTAQQNGGESESKESDAMEVDATPSS